MIKLACVGGGVTSAVGRAHMSALSLDKTFEIESGVFSLDQDVNVRSAQQYGVDPTRLYENLDDLIASEKDRVDAVAILTPTDQHHAQVLSCLRAGLNVISEKALTSTSTEAEEISKYVEDHNGYLAVTFNYTGYPMVRELQKMISDGELGKINQIHIEMPSEGFIRTNQDGEFVTPQSWRLRDHASPTVSLDLGVHLHSLIHLLIDETPMKATALSSSFGGHPVVDNVIALVKYKKDIDVSMWYSKSALGYRNGLKLRIFGQRGAATWLQEEPEYLHLSDSNGNLTRLDRGSLSCKIANQDRYTRFKAGHPAGFIEAFANYYADVADDLIKLRTSSKSNDTSSEYVMGADVALQGLKLFEALNIASNKSEWVDIS